MQVNEKKVNILWRKIWKYEKKVLSLQSISEKDFFALHSYCLVRVTSEGGSDEHPFSMRSASDGSAR